MPRNNTLVIRTPEGIVFSQILAGPMPRFLAWVVDAACIGGLSAILGFVMVLLSLISSDFAGAVRMLLYFIISIGYGLFMEWHWRGQTLGKRLLRLRVVDAEGLRLQFSQVAIRNLLRAVDILPVFYLVGGIISCFSKRSQRMGDLAANTIVVRIPNLQQPDLNQLLAGKYNSLRDHPHLAARLRHQVSPAEAAFALNALLRRDQLEPAARVELFQQVAAHFRAKADFPPEAAEGLSDEQYVRNIADVIYRPRNVSSAVSERKQESTAA